MKPKYFIAILIAAIGIITYGYATRPTSSSQARSTSPTTASAAFYKIVHVANLDDSLRKRPTGQQVPQTATPIPLSLNVRDSAPPMAVIDSTNTDMPDAASDDPTDGMSDQEKSVFRIINSTAIAMFIRHDPKNASIDMMSRCPSGYQYYMTDTSATNDLRMGMIMLYKGCDGHKICQFKINLLTGVVWLKDKKSKEFVTVSEYERKRWGKAT